MITFKNNFLNFGFYPCYSLSLKYIKNILWSGVIAISNTKQSNIKRKKNNEKTLAFTPSGRSHFCNVNLSISLSLIISLHLYCHHHLPRQDYETKFHFRLRFKTISVNIAKFLVKVLLIDSYMDI